MSAPSNSSPISLPQRLQAAVNDRLLPPLLSHGKPSFAKVTEGSLLSAPERKLVVGDGFEPSKGEAQLIYSQSPLATWVTHRTKGAEIRAQSPDCQEQFCAGAGLRSW